MIAHGYLCASMDHTLLVPDVAKPVLCFFARIDARRLNDGKALTAEDVAGTHHLRVDSRHGVIDVMRGGFKRLANRLGDRVDLEKLERVNGQLPVAPIPGLDDQD